MKKLKLLISTIAIMTAMNITVFAGQWKQDNTGWWYQNDDGSYPVNAWFQDTDYKWYYFNNSGYMQTSPITLADGVTYTFDADGSCPNRWSGAANQSYYDPNSGTIKNVGAELALRDYLNSINELPENRETEESFE